MPWKSEGLIALPFWSKIWRLKIMILIAGEALWDLPMKGCSLNLRNVPAIEAWLKFRCKYFSMPLFGMLNALFPSMAHLFFMGHSAPQGKLRLLFWNLTKKCEILIKSPHNFAFLGLFFFNFQKPKNRSPSFTYFATVPKRPLWSPCYTRQHPPFLESRNCLHVAFHQIQFHHWRLPS